MSWIPYAAMTLLFGVGIWAAIEIARGVQREVDAANKEAGDTNKRPGPYQRVWSALHWIWVAVIPGAKYVHRKWKTAPEDSAEKLFWTMVLAAAIAAAIWIVMKILDGFINREPRPVTESGTAQ